MFVKCYSFAPQCFSCGIYIDYIVVGYIYWLAVVAQSLFQRDKWSIKPQQCFSHEYVVSHISTGSLVYITGLLAALGFSPDLNDGCSSKLDWKHAVHSSTHVVYISFKKERTVEYFNHCVNSSSKHPQPLSIMWHVMSDKHQSQSNECIFHPRVEIWERRVLAARMTTVYFSKSNSTMPNSSFHQGLLSNLMWAYAWTPVYETTLVNHYIYQPTAKLQVS